MCWECCFDLAGISKFCARTPLHYGQSPNVCAVCEELLIYQLIHWLVGKLSNRFSYSHNLRLCVWDRWNRKCKIPSNHSGNCMYHAPFRRTVTEKNGYFTKHRVVETVNDYSEIGVEFLCIIWITFRLRRSVGVRRIVGGVIAFVPDVGVFRFRKLHVLRKCSLGNVSVSYWSVPKLRGKLHTTLWIVSRYFWRVIKLDTLHPIK